MNGPALVLVDQHDGTLSGPTRELLTLARVVAPGEAPAALWLGDPDGVDLAGLGQYGVGTVYVPDFAGHERHAAAAAAEAIAAVVERANPAALLFASTFENKEVAAHLAVRLGAGAVVDGTGLERSADGTIVVEKTVFAGTWTSRCAVTTGTPLLGLKSHATEAEPAAAPSRPTVQVVPVTFTPAASAVRIVERSERHASGGRPDLTEARVVVVGGRGTEGDFTPIEQLADVLGAAVGATRVATDEGWIDHSAQIGQTGVTIAPRLYIGAGVSGAIHHRSGMQAAETIVAVNTDADAPIFELADLGIVGDLTEVLPQAASEIKRLRGE
jgi:electron transfer flavoprotein alpha subunit